MSAGRCCSLTALVVFAAVVASGALVTSARAEPVSAASRLSRADASSEYWDLSAVFESGHKVFARFTISNVGPGSGTAYALGQVVFPDGRVVAFKNGRREGRWRLSADGLRVEIGSSLLDLHDPVRRLEVDKNKAGQKVYLSFEPAPEVARSWKSSAPAYRHDLLNSATPIVGTLFIRDMMPAEISVRGFVTATHTSMETIETEETLRRVELHSGSTGESVYLIDRLSPKGASKRWLVVQRAGDPDFETDAFEVDYVGGNDASRPGYPVPTRLVVRGPEVNGTIELGPLQVRHDPLDIAPQPFKWLLSLTMEPSHLWFEATSKLMISRAGTPDYAVTTSGVLSVFFVNEM